MAESSLHHIPPKAAIYNLLSIIYHKHIVISNRRTGGFYVYHAGLFHDGSNSYHIYAQYHLPDFIQAKQKTIYEILGNFLAGILRYVPAGFLSPQLEFHLSRIRNAATDAGTSGCLCFPAWNTSLLSD